MTIFLFLSSLLLCTNATYWQKKIKSIGSSIVLEMLKDKKPFYTYEHYPNGDVWDEKNGSFYYYHAHRENEHGHFHIFVSEPGDKKTFYHLVAISMNARGEPIRLFLTPPEVTGQSPKEPEELIKLIDQFAISHGYPSRAANRYLTELVHELKPQIAKLIRSGSLDPVDIIFKDK